MVPAQFVVEGGTVADEVLVALSTLPASVEWIALFDHSNWVRLQPGTQSPISGRVIHSQNAWYDPKSQRLVYGQPSQGGKPQAKQPKQPSQPGTEQPQQPSRAHSIADKIAAHASGQSKEAPTQQDYHDLVRDVQNLPMPERVNIRNKVLSSFGEGAAQKEFMANAMRDYVKRRIKESGADQGGKPITHVTGNVLGTGDVTLHREGGQKEKLPGYANEPAPQGSREIPAPGPKPTTAQDALRQAKQEPHQAGEGLSIPQEAPGPRPTTAMDALREAKQQAHSASGVLSADAVAHAAERVAKAKPGPEQDAAIRDLEHIRQAHERGKRDPQQDVWAKLEDMAREYDRRMGGQPEAKASGQEQPAAPKPPAQAKPAAPASPQPEPKQAEPAQPTPQETQYEPGMQPPETKPAAPPLAAAPAPAATPPPPEPQPPAAAPKPESQAPPPTTADRQNYYTPPPAKRPSDMTPEEFKKGKIFKTSQGSIYYYDPETGSTTRIKSNHERSGHEAGDIGLKDPSAKTVYVPNELAGALSSAGMQGEGANKARVVIKDGKATLVTWNAKENRWGASPLSRDVPIQNHPAEGLQPLEMWKPASDVPGYSEVYSKMHAGNTITSLGDATDADHAEFERAAGKTQPEATAPEVAAQPEPAPEQVAPEPQKPETPLQQHEQHNLRVAEHNKTLSKANKIINQRAITGQSHIYGPLAKINKDSNYDDLGPEEKKALDDVAEQSGLYGENGAHGEQLFAILKRGRLRQLGKPKHQRTFNAMVRAEAGDRYKEYNDHRARHNKMLKEAANAVRSAIKEGKIPGNIKGGPAGVAERLRAGDLDDASIKGFDTLARSMASEYGDLFSGSHGLGMEEAYNPNENFAEQLFDMLAAGPMPAKKKKDFEKDVMDEVMAADAEAAYRKHQHHAGEAATAEEDFDTEHDNARREANPPDVEEAVRRGGEEADREPPGDEVAGDSEHAEGAGGGGGGELNPEDLDFNFGANEVAPEEAGNWQSLTAHQLEAAHRQVPKMSDADFGDLRNRVAEMPEAELHDALIGMGAVPGATREEMADQVNQMLDNRRRGQNRQMIVPENNASPAANDLRSALTKSRTSPFLTDTEVQETLDRMAKLSPQEIIGVMQELGLPRTGSRKNELLQRIRQYLTAAKRTAEENEV